MGYEFRQSPSPLVHIAWQSVAVDGGTYTDAANEYWGFSFNLDPRGSVTAWLAGPSVVPRDLITLAGECSWGVELTTSTLLHGVPKLDLLGELRELPCDGSFFEIAGVRYPVTAYDDLERLVSAMHSQGVLVHDPALARALDGDEAGYSERQLRRRFRDATALGPSKHAQLRRAREAYRLLTAGRSLAEAANEAGYSDQAHMTRAMRDLSGLTPSQLLGDDLDPFLSRPV